MSEVLDRIENRDIAIGEKRGEKRGRKKMAYELNQLYAILLEQDRIDDLKRAVTDTNYQQQLMSEYGIGAEEDEDHS